MGNLSFTSEGNDKQEGIFKYNIEPLRFNYNIGGVNQDQVSCTTAQRVKEGDEARLAQNKSRQLQLTILVNGGTSSYNLESQLQPEIV